MKIIVEYITNTGLLKKNNEDSLLIGNKLISNTSMSHSVKTVFTHEDIFLCAVADGMGGHGNGEIASELILNCLKKNIGKINDIESLKEVLFVAKNDLDLFTINNFKFLNIGTVLAGILFKNNEFLVFNVGDSRVYENNRGYLKQLSKDHSFVYSLYESGNISYEDIKNHSQKHIVTSAFIGNMKMKLDEIFIRKYSIKEFPKEFFICSDGVWEATEINDLDKIFTEVNPIQFLMQQVLNNGAADNFSAIFIKVFNE